MAIGLSRLPIEFWGLSLNILGGIVIAAPDIPKVRDYMTRKELRSIVSRLEDGEIVEKGDTGFNKLMNILEQTSPRMPQDRECIAVSLGETPYGNPKLKGDFGLTASECPRNDLVEWIVFEQELRERRDWVRWAGLILFLFGFVLQLVQYI